ncbi:MAG: Flp pilus assembly protein CpaB [Candidatus Thiodiazotropha sp.]
MDVINAKEVAGLQNKNGVINKNVIMLVISLIVGIGGIYLTKDFIERKINYYRSQLEKTEKMVTLVVPNRNIQRGSIVTLRDFVKRDIPAKYAHKNAVTQSTFNTAVGQKISFDITEGRPLLWAHLEGGVYPTFSGKLEPGTRALSFTVDKVNSISGFLQPNDKIDLLLDYNDQIVPIVQNLHVIATGDKTRIDKTGRQSADTYNIVTVVVTPEIAKKITLARTLGKITALLRSPHDEQSISNEPMTIARLFNKPKQIINVKRRIITKEKGIEYIVGGRGS